MPFTTSWIFISFEPQTTTDLPLLSANSFAAFAIAASQANAEEGSADPPTSFATALYKLTATFPCSETFTGTRSSAFAPVKERFDSN